MNHPMLVLISTIGLVACSITGCGRKEVSSDLTPKGATDPPTAAQPLTPQNPGAAARALFATKCVVCHGDHGAGDGPGSAALNPKPRAFADAAWQAAVTDESLKKIILEGGAAVGKSPAMPSNPDLKGKDQEVAELVKIVRRFKH